jgi:flagellar basal-body rod protein FlgC
MVAYPNINLTTEFTDALEATRAYQANIGVMEVTKSIGQQTLRILA